MGVGVGVGGGKDEGFRVWGVNVQGGEGGNILVQSTNAQPEPMPLPVGGEEGESICLSVSKIKKK